MTTPPMSDATALFFLSLILLWLVSLTFQIYGIYRCFKKKWYMGVAALLVPGFALVVGVARAVFKKDILT